MKGIFSLSSFYWGNFNFFGKTFFNMSWDKTFFHFFLKFLYKNRGVDTNYSIEVFYEKKLCLFFT